MLALPGVIAVPKGFSPASISGLTVWLDGADASTINTTGTAVDSWTSKVNSSIVLTPHFAGVRPTFNNNGTGLIFTNATRGGASTQSLKYTQNTGILLSENYTLISAWRPLRNDDSFRVCGTFWARSGSGAAIIGYNHIGNEGNTHGILNSALSDWLTFNSFTPNQTLMKRIDVIIGGASPLSFINGVQTTTFSARIGSGFVLGGTHPLIEFSVSAFGRAMDGHCYEVLLYNKQLTTSERQQVEAYLNAKWGI